MIKNQMDIDHRSKREIDAGCGTAIITLMPSKQGESEVHAFDVDEWSVSNGRENIEVNGCTNIFHYQGKLGDLNLEGPFDIILANINKNVLLDEIHLYKQFLGPEGLLVLSGFYVTDIPDLLAESAKHGLSELRRDEREGWACLVLHDVIR